MRYRLLWHVLPRAYWRFQYGAEAEVGCTTTRLGRQTASANRDEASEKGEQHEFRRYGKRCADDTHLSTRGATSNVDQYGRAGHRNGHQLAERDHSANGRTCCPASAPNTPGSRGRGSWAPSSQPGIFSDADCTARQWRPNWDSKHGRSWWAEWWIVVGRARQPSFLPVRCQNFRFYQTKNLVKWIHTAESATKSRPTWPIQSIYLVAVWRALTVPIAKK